MDDKTLIYQVTSKDDVLKIEINDGMFSEHKEDSFEELLKEIKDIVSPCSDSNIIVSVFLLSSSVDVDESKSDETLNIKSKSTIKIRSNNKLYSKEQCKDINNAVLRDIAIKADEQLDKI